MVFDISKVSGISGGFFEEEKTVGEGVDAEKVLVYRAYTEGLEGSEQESMPGKAFLVVRKNTIEVRTDRKLAELLREKYESVMESRYFGRGGIEVVLSGQFSDDEIYDLVRLSYNLTKEEARE